MQILYENEEVQICLPRSSAVLGHLQLIVKDCMVLSSCSEEKIARIFKAASIISSVLFETLQAGGTNMLITEGLEKKVVINILARRESDGLDLLWEPTQLSDSDMQDAFSAISEKAFFVGKTSMKKELSSQDNSHKEPEQQIVDVSDDERIKRLRRIA